MTFGLGPSVFLHQRVSSPVARAQMRKVYRYSRKGGNTKFDSRMLVARSVLAIQAEGDENFAMGVSAEQRCRRIAVDILRRTA